MKKAFRFLMGMIATVLLMQADGSVTAQDRFDLKAANGISFSEIKGYEAWQVIAPSYRIDNHELRIILGNSVMVDAYRSGIPGNGKSFPEGAIVVKIGWFERKSTAFPAAFEPDVLKRVEFIIKDSKRFPVTSGWGYARFLHDAQSGSFTPYGKDATFAKECHQCHTAVMERDFIFTGYPAR
jgi:hypothetical protein